MRLPSPMGALLAALLLAPATAALPRGAPFVPDPSYTHAQFMVDFGGRTTQPPFGGRVSAAHRRDAFEKNLQSILAQNEAYRRNRSTWYAAVNEFADWTAEEMATLRGHRRGLHQRIRANARAATDASDGEGDLVIMSPEDLPEAVDWRTKNVVTPPKSQGGCGACWAFATTEAVESFVALQTGNAPPELAPQQLVDCVQNPNQCGGKGGCSGGVAELGFDYIAQHGLALESDYPYHAKDGRCAAATAAATVSGFQSIKPNDANALLSAVAQKGPIAISAAAKTWGFYFGGVFDGSLGDHCDVDVDHAVQLVGYGTDTIKGNKTAYWLVRNSWGPKWGESGYIRVLRNPEKEPCAQDPSPLDGVCGKSGACKCNQTVTYCGTCGILADSSYPTGAKLQSSADAAPAEFPPRDASTNYATGYVWSDSPAKAQAPVLSEAPNFAAALASTPSSIDWRTKGNVVSPVKDQGQCGACWAFSTAENVESAFALATNTPVQKLSVEQILVCCGDDISTCSGCMGGDPIVAYGYLQNRSAGLDSEAAYPYDPHTDPFDPPKCKADVSKPVAKVTGWSYAVPRCEGGECAEEWRTGGGAEEQLAAVVATQGPVSICIDAEKSLKNYKGGVLDPDDCSTAVKSLNHCVHLVGFDTSGDEPYWLVKNSWGEKFGEDGYFRLAYGKNACGITDEATVVHVAKP